MNITYEDVKKCFKMLESNSVRKPYCIIFMANGRKHLVKAYTASGCWRKISRLQRES